MEKPARVLSKAQLISDLASEVARRLVTDTEAEVRRLTAPSLNLIEERDPALHHEVTDLQEFSDTDDFEAYESQMLTIIGALMSQLHPHQIEALWLQTDEGEAWSKSSGVPAVLGMKELGDTASYVLKTFVWPDIGRWSVDRLERYLRLTAASIGR